MENWFATWFDSPYYHMLYKNRNQTEAKQFIHNIVSFLKPEQNATALDLACGKGRHSLELSKHGLNVLGVDLSPNSIEFANQFSNENLKFVVHDMRQPLNQQFNLIFNLFTSFGYFENLSDNQKVINAVHKSLPNNGIFVIDFLNAAKVINNLVTEETKTVDEVQFNITRKVTNGFIVKTIDFTNKGKNYHFQEKVAAFYLEDFIDFFKGKFKVQAVFGNYNLDAFTAKTSNRLILVAEKI